MEILLFDLSVWRSINHWKLKITVSLEYTISEKIIKKSGYCFKNGNDRSCTSTLISNSASSLLTQHFQLL